MSIFDILGYKRREDICGNCGMPIIQWEARPEAGYCHTHNNMFACDKQFQKAPIMAFSAESHTLNLLTPALKATEKG